MFGYRALVDLPRILKSGQAQTQLSQMFFCKTKALSAPVTTRVPTKLGATCACSNTLVIDARQVLLSAPTAPLTPQATTSPSLLQVGVKTVNRVYLGGSPTGESSVELIDHLRSHFLNHNNILYFTFYYKSNNESLFLTYRISQLF